MKKMIIAGMVLGLLLPASFLRSQTAQISTALESLNKFMAAGSMTGVAFELSGDGALLRHDQNGNKFKFRSKDIVEFAVDYDGVIGNLLLKCAPGRSVIEFEIETGAQKGTSEFMVVSFQPDTDIDEAVRLFKALQAALEKT